MGLNPTALEQNEIVSHDALELTEPTNPPSPTNDDANTQEKIGVARASGVIALGNISSRILGLVREIILSYLFGAGAAVDAFKIAIIVPRGLYDLLIGGHVNSALVPVLSDYANRKNRRDLWELVNALLGIVLITLIVLVIALELLAPSIIRLIASDKTSPDTLQKATDLLRITAPALLFLSLSAIISGLLISLKRFTWPAFGVTVFNLMIVLVTIAFEGQIGITAAALGWLIGAILQLLIQFVDLRDGELWPRFRSIFKHSGVRQIGLLYIPVMLTLGLDVLVNRPFSYHLAARTGEGNISYMEWAGTLIQFPHGLVAIAISIAVLPTLSQQAAHARNHLADLSIYKDTLSFGLRLATVLILPATIGLYVLAIPVVSLIFQHGASTMADTENIALALRLYLLGLPFATIDLLLVFAFYARQDTTTPAAIGFLTLLVYMATALLLLPRYGFWSLMVADSVKHVLHSGISGWILWRRIGGLRGQSLASTAFRTIIASALMGLCTWLSSMGISQFIEVGPLVNNFIHVAGACSVSIVVFLIIGYRLQLKELHWVVGFLKQRFNKG